MPVGDDRTGAVVSTGPVSASITVNSTATPSSAVSEYDKVVLIEDGSAFEREFLDIFTVLSHAKITQFDALRASFSELSENLLLACVDWQFIGDNGEIFTDFSAFYHIAFNNGQWKIFNVVSQELSQSVQLNTPLNISYKINE